MTAERGNGEGRSGGFVQHLRPTTITLPELAERVELVVDGQLEHATLLGQAMGAIGRIERAVSDLRVEVTGQRGRLDSVPDEGAVEEIVRAQADARELEELKAAKERRRDSWRKVGEVVVAAIIVGVLGALGGYVMGHARGLQDAPAAVRP